MVGLPLIADSPGWRARAATCGVGASAETARRELGGNSRAQQAAPRRHHAHTTAGACMRTPRARVHTARIASHRIASHADRDRLLRELAMAEACKWTPPTRPHGCGRTWRGRASSDARRHCARASVCLGIHHRYPNYACPHTPLFLCTHFRGRASERVCVHVRSDV